MKKNIYRGVACGLLAAALVYPCDPFCWFASFICLCLCVWFMQRAELKSSIKSMTRRHAARKAA